MKTTDEWLIDIKEKTEKRYEKKRKTHRTIVRVSCALCLAIAVSAAVALPEHTDERLPLNASSKTSAEESSRVTKPENENALRLFPFKSAPIVGKTAATKKYRDPKEHCTETWSAEKMTAYWGKDLLNLHFLMPDDLEYTEKDGFDVTFYKDGTLVEDAQYIWYKGNNGREVCISVGKVMVPYDCKYEFDKEYTEKFNNYGKDTFNGVEMQCGNYKKVHGEETSFFTDADYFYYADFKKDGLYYRIECYNLYPHEFRKIIEEFTNM